MNDGRDEPDREAGERQSDNGPFVPKSASEALQPEPVPGPPLRSGRARSQIVVAANFVMTIIVLAVVVGGGGFYLLNRMFREPGPLPQSATYMVQKGDSVGQIAEGLESRHIISDARVFTIAKRLYMAHGSLKAGEYEIGAHASMREVMELLESGKSILYSLTFPEGLTVKEMFDLLASDTALSGPLPEKPPAEGTLMPDTYKFTRGTARQEIIDKMKAADRRVVDGVWKDRDPDTPVKTKQDLVILASIVEKETGKADERPLVASVFMNRLRKGMRLQSDPTVIYGVYGPEGKPSGRPLYQSDLEKKTPYNTYLINGLPPAPICNPGRASLEAVANPSKTGDLYFVADGTGGHVFSSNLKDHNANVRRWREMQAARKQDDGSVTPDAAKSGD